MIFANNLIAKLKTLEKKDTISIITNKGTITKGTPAG